MTRETLVPLSPERVLELAKDYFTGTASGYAGSLVEEGPDYVRFRTFRGQLAIATARAGDRTRVRCSTLRYHPSIGKFLLQIETEPSTSGS